MDAAVVVQLRGSEDLCYRKRSLLDCDALLQQLQAVGPPFTVERRQGTLAASLTFTDADAALITVCNIWRLRLQGFHNFLPILCNDSKLKCVKDRLEELMMQLFLDHLAGIREGEGMQKHRRALEKVRQDVNQVCFGGGKLRPLSFPVWKEKLKLVAYLRDISGGLDAKLSEFAHALDCISVAIEKITSRGGGRQAVCNGSSVKEPAWPVYWENTRSWHGLHCILERECARFTAGLPLYAKRGQVLRMVFENQVTIIAAETGSGKSSQVVQYLADAGFAGNGGTIVCSQPRRVAATALAQRVEQEAAGCSKSGCAVGCLVSSPCERVPNADIVFTTDYILLQLCVTDPDLKQFRCVVVDEVHERGLNTDLLLAMLKRCLARRPDLKLIIMSATADTELISSYFGVCSTLSIQGRCFPVDMIYEPVDERKSIKSSSFVDGYLQRVIDKVAMLHLEAGDGDILAFLTSHAEVEWACSQDFSASATVLPLHGKMEQEEQRKVFLAAEPGKRKIIFATNFAETSITIPGVKFVIDPGVFKQNIFDPGTGMHILRICVIDQSTAKQRAGRAGRTQPGKCFCLYTEEHYNSMKKYSIPEILRVHLGVAALRLLSLGVHQLEAFDFVDAPSPAAIAQAVDELRQLGAVEGNPGGLHLTCIGWQLLKLELEPRSGKVILDAMAAGFGREGLVLAALMSSGSIFSRAGTEEMKVLADCQRMRFCHPHGDLLTFLSVYQEWESTSQSSRISWCRANSVSSRAISRCHDVVKDLQVRTWVQLNAAFPQSWSWSKDSTSATSDVLRKILVTVMIENLAMFRGHESLGFYDVSSGQQVHLHPASALQVFGSMPLWVVYGTLLQTSRKFITAVTVVKPEWIPKYLSESRLQFLNSRVLHKATIFDLSEALLRKFVGPHFVYLRNLEKQLHDKSDPECIIEPCFEERKLSIYAMEAELENVQKVVDSALERERRWMNNECSEECIVNTSVGRDSSVMLFGAGAKVRQIVMPDEYIRVEVFCDHEVDEKTLLCAFDRCGEGISGFQKHRHHLDRAGENPRKWGSILFCSISSAQMAVKQLNGRQIGRSKVKVLPASAFAAKNFENRPCIFATVRWPRRQMKGIAIVRCAEVDIDGIVASCSGRLVKDSIIYCRRDSRRQNSVFLDNVTPDITEDILRQALESFTSLPIDDIFLPRLRASPSQPSIADCEFELQRLVSMFVPLGKCEVKVQSSNPSDFHTRASLKFHGSIHESASRALAHLQGKVMRGFQPWQTIECQREFTSWVQCSCSIFRVLEDDIKDLIEALKHQIAKLTLVVKGRSDERGCHSIKISANSVISVARCKSALEKLLEGLLVEDEDIGKSALQHLIFCREGQRIANSVELTTRTVIIRDSRSYTAKIFGSKFRKVRALKLLIFKLRELHEQDKRREICLKGDAMPNGLMKEVIKRFGADLKGLGQSESSVVSIDHRRHVLHVEGDDEAVSQVKRVVAEVANELRQPGQLNHEETHQLGCPICFCPFEDKYSLAGCGHSFCISCLVNQVKSAIHHRDGFPLTCAREGCSRHILLYDLHVLLSAHLQEELQKASLNFFVAANHRFYRFCITADCPGVYKVSHKVGMHVCPACKVRVCTSCHVEYHEDLTCAEYRLYKEDPDTSLQAWRSGKKDVKTCPSCSSVIEKIEGCNHMTCKCGFHLCWVCLECFADVADCYAHLQEVHGGLM